jgi:hypothetical protein
VGWGWLFASWTVVRAMAETAARSIQHRGVDSDMKLKATGADLRLAQLLFVVCICNMQLLDHSDCSLCNGEPIQLWSYWPPLIVYVHGSSGAYSAAVDNCPWLLDAAASCHIISSLSSLMPHLSVAYSAAVDNCHCLAGCSSLTPTA